MDLRVGIIGCGKVAANHVNAFASLPSACVAAVYDVHALAAQHVASGCGAVAVASPEEMLSGSAHVDAVVICTPPTFHLDCARPFVESGIPVLCEKPLAATLQQAMDIKAMVERAGSMFMVGFCHRFHPSVIELKKLISDGTFGRIVLMRNAFLGSASQAGTHRADRAVSGGGVLIDQGSHSVYLFHHLVGPTVKVHAFTTNAIQQIGVEDNCALTLATAEGAIGDIAASYSVAVPDFRLELYGEKGIARLVYGAEDGVELHYRLGGDAQWTAVDSSAHPPRFVGQAHHFIDCVRRSATPETDAASGVAVSRVIAAAYDHVPFSG